MMQQELKNCPFCGGTELTYINHRRCIRCKSCDAEGPYEPTGTEDNLWNTRAALTAQEQIDALYGTIKSQKQTHDALIKMNTELLEALKEVRDAIRTEGVLNSMKYDELGVKVYQAIASAEGQKAAGE